MKVIVLGADIDEAKSYSVDSKACLYGSCGSRGKALAVISSRSGLLFLCNKYMECKLVEVISAVKPSLAC